MSTAARIDRQQIGGSVVLTLPDAAYPMVRFVVAHRLGALLDPAPQAGVTHLMAEALLRGTKARSRRAFAQALDTMGASLDTSVGQELLVVRGTTLRRHLDRVWDLVTEALCTPAFAADEFEDLRDELREALRQERDDDDAVADLFLQQAQFEGHPLMQSPAGTEASLRDLRIDDVVRAYERLDPTQLIFAFAGDIQPDITAKLTQSLLSQWQARPRAPLPRVAPPPQHAAPRLIVVDKPERTQVQLRLACTGPLGSAAKREAFWLGVMAFGGTFLSPYTKEVRDVRGWSYFAHADYPRRTRFAAPVVLRCAPALGDAAPALSLSLEMLDALGRGELAAEHIEHARTYLLGRYPFEVATAYDMMGVALAQEACGMSPTTLFDFPERLRELTVPEVQAAVAGALNFSGHVALLVAPQAEAQAMLEAAKLPHEVRILDFRAGLL